MIFLKPHTTHFPCMHYKRFKFGCHQLVIKGSYLKNNVPLHLYLGFYLRDSPKISSLPLHMHALKPTEVCLRQVKNKLDLQNKVPLRQYLAIYPRDSSAVSWILSDGLPRNFTPRTWPRMRNKRSNCGYDRSIIKGTSSEEQCTISDVSRFLLEGFSWKFISWTFHSYTTNLTNFLAIAH